MAFDFISDLAESRLYPSKQHLAKRTPREVADAAHAMLCALRVLLTDEDQQDWARAYARATIQYGTFAQWHSNGNDLYTAINALVSAIDLRADPHDHGHDLRRRLPIDQNTLRSWLRAEATGHPSTSLTRRLFTNIDDWLGVRDSSLHAIRRIVLNWDHTEHSQRALAVTRLVQLLTHLAGTGEMLPRLRKLAGHHGLLIRHATDPDGSPDRPFSLLRGVAENASAGATSAASVATVAGAPGGLGVGFSTDMSKSIYYKKPQKKKPTPMIRR